MTACTHGKADGHAEWGPDRSYSGHSRLQQAVPVAAALARHGPGPAGVGVGARGLGRARIVVCHRRRHVGGRTTSPSVEVGSEAGGG